MATRLISKHPNSDVGYLAIVLGLSMLLASLFPKYVVASPGVESPLYPIYLQGPNAREREASAAAFVARIREKGSLSVIVGLRFTLRDADKLSSSESGAQSAALETMQGRVAARVLDNNQPEVIRYSFIPFMATTVNEVQFQKLLADPDVASIEENAVYMPQLNDTIPLIHASDVLKKYGFSGIGRVIAVLDSGIAKTHPMLVGKILSEACYSTPIAAENRSSLCPNGVRQSTARGSGVNCPIKIDGCEHGTIVASIAAGGPIGTLRGVASGAGIIAIQIMSVVTGQANCGGAAKCISTQNSDIVSGLDRVYALRQKFKIAAVNLSISGGLYSSACDVSHPAQAASVAALRQAGIAVIAASGNDGSDTKVGSPACLSGVITVAASSKADKAKHVEYYYQFSNLNSLVKLLAPGVDVFTAVPGGSKCATAGSPYCRNSGTSLAAPHVAGAFAVLKGAFPKATNDGILNALECSGKTVELTGDDSNPYRLARPRIDLLGAYNWLKGIPKRSWDFSKTTQDLDWSPVFAKWTVSNGQYHPDPPSTFIGYMMSSVGNCAHSVDVSADMTRKTALGGEFDQRFDYGIMIGAHFDPLSRAPSGYMFTITHFPKDPTPALRVLYRIYRIDNNHWTELNRANSSGPAKFNAENTIRVTSDDTAHKFYVNGQLVLSAANDGIYQSGQVVLYSYFDFSLPTTAGTFSVNNVSITSRDPAP